MPLQVRKSLAAIPALAIWCWGLGVAVIALTQRHGRVMRAIAIGDLLLDANFATFFTFMVLDGARRSLKLQAGEFITVSGSRDGRLHCLLGGPY